MKKAFRMKLNEGSVEQYKKNHENVYPQLEKLFLKAGVKEYTIWFDEETNYLFAYLDVENIEAWNEIPSSDICKKWWEFMAPIMATNEDNSPVSVDLKNVYEYKR